MEAEGITLSWQLSDAEYEGLMDAYANSFESAGMVDAIQAGTTGRLAISLVFYTHRNRQEVGVDWMEISDASSAAAVASAQLTASVALIASVFLSVQLFRHGDVILSAAEDEILQ